jgi:hypothetical protein
MMSKYREGMMKEELVWGRKGRKGEKMRDSDGDSIH